MTERTNISTEPLGMLDGMPIRPCMKSGFCCTKAPCMYGAWDAVKHQCIHLGDPNEIGQRDCGIYQWIIDNVPTYEFYPGFGTGCCMPLGNQLRQQIIQNLKDGL